MTTRTLALVLGGILFLITTTSALAQQGQRYAILCGVQKYSKSSGLSDLNYTEKDIEELATVLVSSGYKSGNVTVLTQKKALTENDLKFLPTRKNVMDEIEGRLSLLDAEDSVLVAFAGHGLQFKNDKDCYFCPADAILDDKESLVSMNGVYGRLEKCKASIKLVICDACRNSPVAAGTRRAIVDLESVSRPQEIEPPGGVAALYSCSQGQIAYENGELGHGVFFHYVIAGLKGAADFDKDRHVDLLELAKYTQKGVKDYVFEKYDRATQVPQLLGTTRGVVPLLSLPALTSKRVLGTVDSWVVTVDSTPIQSGDKVVGTARRGDRYTLLKEENGWMNVTAASSFEPLGWIQKQHLKNDPAGGKGQDLLVQQGEQWWPAWVVKVEADRWLVRYYGFDEEEWVTRERTTAADQRLKPFNGLVEWKGKHWPCNILQTQGDQYLVSYMGFNSSWNEWTPKSRVVRLNLDSANNRRMTAELSEP